MGDTLISFLLTWLLLWAVMSVIYAALLFALDYIAEWWQRQQRAKRQQRAHLAELARIELQTRGAVQRIGAGFLVAQQLIRAEAASERERRS